MTDINEIKRELEALTAKVAAYEAAKARNWPERIEAGMVFRHRGGAVYVWAHDRCQELVCIVAGGASRCGDVFDKDLVRACMDSFSYLGHARDLIKIADDAHEPTGAELVGKYCEYSADGMDWDKWSKSTLLRFHPEGIEPFERAAGVRTRFSFARLAK